MLRSSSRALAAAVLLAAVARPCAAQSLSARLANLFRYGNCAQPLCLTVNEAVHGSHYIPGAVQANLSTLGFLTDAIGATLGSIPVSATTSGVTFRFVGGAPASTATSAGPIFAERAQTLGRGRLLVGVNTTRIAFDRVRGTRLDDLAFNFVHQDVDPSGLGTPGYESDVIRVRPSIALTLQSTAAFVTYGLGDRVDVGVAVPLVWASLDASSTALITTTTGGTPTGAHRFGTQASPSLNASSAAEGSNFGIGDVALRAKANLRTSDRLGLALLGDVRLPTGDADNFAGSGELAVRALGVLSARVGNFSPHANAGFAFRGGDSQTDAALLTVGFDHLAARWATVAVDLISEFQVGDSKLVLPAPVTYVDAARTTLPLTNVPNRRDDLYNLSAGAKFLLGGATLVVNGVLPLGNGGVQSRSGIYTLGIERTFR
jgi:hypothetical protein